MKANHSVELCVSKVYEGNNLKGLEWIDKPKFVRDYG